MKALIKEIEGFPEHDDHQKADQFAEQQTIESPKIAGNNADSQIQPPFNPRSPGIRKVAIAGIEHIDNATGDRYVRDDYQQDENAVREEVFAAQPQRDEGLDENINAEHKNSGNEIPERNKFPENL